MNFQQSPVSFDRHRRAGTPDDSAQSTDGADASFQDADPATAPDSDEFQGRVWVLWGIPVSVLGFAAAAGAVAATIVVLVVTVFPWRAMLDPRVPQLMHDNADLTTLTRQLTEKLRALETATVAAGQTADAVTARLDTAAGDIDGLKAALGSIVVGMQRTRDAMAGVNAPALFGVGVVQLRDRLDAGQPFDWELVNLRGIAGTEPALVTELERLLPMARNGVLTQAQLLDAMQGLMARYGSSDSLLQSGLGAVSRALGATLMAEPNDAPILARAMARLTMGDLPNFIQAMQGLGTAATYDARPIIAAARQHLLAVQAVQTLAQAARAGLQAQLKNSVSATTAVLPSIPAAR